MSNKIFLHERAPTSVSLRYIFLLSSNPRLSLPSGCKISGFHGNEDRSCGYLGCCTMQCGGWAPALQRTVLPPSSGLMHMGNNKWTYI